MRVSTVPEIEGNDFRLRPLERSDIPAWYAYLRLPQVVEHTSWNLASADDLQPSLDQCESDSPTSSLRFAIVSASDAQFVGNIGFHTISPIHRTAEIAFDLHPDCWARGVATRCCMATVDWGFSERRFVRIQATALDSNRASMRVLEKCGFEFEGLLRNFRLVRGEPRNFRMYSRISPESR